MGLPIFICPTNQQIISSGTSSNSSHSASTTNAANTTSTTSTNTSPTTSFFATATPTRSPTTPTFLPLTTSSNSTAAQNQRRNTYTPPTFSPTRRESLLSTHRLSQAFDFASSLAVEVLSKAADSVFGSDGAEAGQGVSQGIWGEDLEAGEAQRERERKDKARFARFGDEGGFDGWLD